MRNAGRQGCPEPSCGTYLTKRRKSVFLSLSSTLRRGEGKLIEVKSVREYRDAIKILPHIPKRERSKMKRAVKRTALAMFAARGITGKTAMRLYRQGWQWESQEREAKRHGAPKNH